MGACRSLSHIWGLSFDWSEERKQPRRLPWTFYPVMAGSTPARAFHDL